eukprot:TRINITY_DN1082_c0_g1_i10.p2 TRINITY_DN1082_c0_g1~~TRINITY_DN1082_c0_g1_i10.p2  ORF type:complete len:620 (-),score=92.36 TRINITY_DN1082_c0_g1_i10:195-2054(-)
MKALQIEDGQKNKSFKIGNNSESKIAELQQNSGKSDIGIKVDDEELSCTTLAVPYYRPFIKYEIAVWIFYGIFTILAIVDRFVWNIWPRHMYTIGAGSAGTDFTDGLKPGPWSVKFFDVCARVSGRFSIVALNLLLFTMMKTSMSWISESWIAQYVVDMSDSVEGNHRLHKWNGIMICILTLLHTWSILFPCIFQNFQAKVVLGSFEWPISERNPPGFKDVDPKTETVMLQGDDVWRLIEMTLLLAILMPLSLRWLQTKWHLGIHVHNFISIAYFIDIVRRHTHPHSWILNTPFFIVWLGDVFVGIFWRRHKPEIYRKQLSNDYILLFWNQACSLATVGPKYYIRMRPSSFLERAHVFTAFENRCGLDMADGRDWSVGLLVRVYRNQRSPVLGKKDKVSHTQRVFDSKDLKMTTWGPFIGGMSDQVKWNIHHAKSVGIVAGGSAAGYIIDALQQHSGTVDADVVVLYTTRDPELLTWLTHWISTMLKESAHTNVKVLLALTHGDKDASSEAEQAMASATKQIAYQNVHDYMRIQSGRIDFSNELPEHTKVFFQGSGGLQKAVEKAAAKRHSHVVAGPAFDQDPGKSRSFGDYWRRMNCCTVQEGEEDQKTPHSVPTAQP